MSNYLLLIMALAACGACSAPSPQPQPQGPKQVERELTFKGAGGMELQGTFLAPPSGKNAAVLLLPGSGPTDRDGNSSLGIKPDLLKQIAERLCKEGFATYRFDKRAIARYKASWPTDTAKLNTYFSWNNFVDDAKAAYSAMRLQPEVDPGRCAILGHSEGGLITLDMASQLTGKPEAPKTLVFLGTTGRAMGQVLHDQISSLATAQGAPATMVAQLVDYSDRACSALAKGQPLPPNTPPGLAPIFNPTVLDIMGAYCRIDPAELAKKIKGPVLLINGESDVQVSPTLDAPRLASAFKARPYGSEELMIVPHASHNLKSVQGDKDPGVNGPVVPTVLEKITAFLKEKLAD